MVLRLHQHNIGYTADGSTSYCSDAVKVWSCGVVVYLV